MTIPLPPVMPSIPADGNPRPFWSVMIPAYNPPADYLAQTLRSVLAQDPGPEQMQIEVVDDCSPKVDVAALVREIAGDRVKVSQTPKNLGLAGCWNTSVERARGEWVHLLHQDDLVLPGFYAVLRAGVASDKKVGAAFCRQIFMDAGGHWLFFSSIEQREAGPFDNALERLAEYQRIQTPAIVVRREVYAAVGGFDGNFCFALDWEMWCRIAAQYAIWYEPRPLAVYRSHVGSASSRLQREAADTLDSLRCIKRNLMRMPAAAARRVGITARANLAMLTLEVAWSLTQRGEFSAARAQTRVAFAASCSPPVIRKFIGMAPKVVPLLMRRAVSKLLTKHKGAPVEPLAQGKQG